MAEQAHVKHTFKKRHFARPTRCYYCSQLIWGVGKNGFRCKECGYNVHLNECVAKAANRTSCTPGKEFPAPFKPMVGARITKVKGMIQRKSTSDISSYTEERKARSSSLSKSGQEQVAEDRRGSVPTSVQQGRKGQLHLAQSTLAGLQYQAQQSQAPVSFSQAPAMFTAPTIQKLPSKDAVTRNQDMSAAIAEQQRYIASLQQQIAAHQAILYQSASPAQQRAPMTKPVYQTRYAPAPGYAIQQPVVVYGLDGIGSTEQAPPPAYEPPSASPGNLPAYVESATAQQHPEPPAAPTEEPAKLSSSASAPQSAPLAQPATSARAARRAPLRTSATAEPVQAVAAPTVAPGSRPLVSPDADTIRAQRKSASSDLPKASELEDALRVLQQAPEESVPLDEFKDLTLPGMETICISSGESMEVLKAIAEQYEAKKRAAEAELSALQAQAGEPAGVAERQCVAQPAGKAALPKQEKELGVEERVKLAQEVEGWLAKELDSQYPSENRISKLLSALKGHLQPIACLKRERGDVAVLLNKTRQHDMRAGEMLTVPPLDDCDWLYEGASDSESDEDFYFVEDKPSDMALDPLC